ncbi:MAG: PilC/PilY family type IV pilus protein [Gammaproteobacteria bacterium]|nr:PilC/PilY family type IV pilus protein [Gammaproteobacteria bacterium]
MDSSPHHTKPLRLALAAALFNGTLQAAPLTLSDSPLYLGNSVDPNVFFEVDDSGSMDWEVLTARHWHFCSYTSAGCGWEVDNGLWRSHTGSSYRYFEYLYPNGDNAYTTGCDSGRGALYSCDAALDTNTPYLNDWRVLSSAVNVLYFNPAINYAPWEGPCLSDGSACANVSFSAAPSDPREGTSGYLLRRDLSGFSFELWHDDHGFAGAAPTPGGASAAANGRVDLWDSHSRIRVNASDVTVTTTHYAPDVSGLNPSVTISTVSDGGTLPDGTLLNLTTMRQNIANWYSYHRKRAYVAKSAIAAVIQGRPDFRYGLSVINQPATLFQEVPGAAVTDHSAHNHTLLTRLFTFNWPAAGTPLRRGLENVGRYFDSYDSTPNLGRSNPIIHTCQKNFSILLTDGYWNGSAPLTAAIADNDGDGINDTLGDVAQYYYGKDLSPFANEVPADPFDDAAHQHLSTFTVAFGVAGNLIDSDNDGWPNQPLNASDNWGDPASCSDCPPKIDDLWHAAYNSRGTYISADTPNAVVESLQAALSNITNRISSATSVSLNSSQLQTDSLVFQARFDSGDWHGELLAYQLLADGSVATTALWNAAEAIPAAANRHVLSHNGSQGITFRWANLNAAQQAALNTHDNGTVDGLGSLRLDYLRGDGSQETRLGGPFRSRPVSVLGDIVHSSPVFVGAPALHYPDSWGTGAAENCSGCGYSAFRSANAARPPMVYVGANDGMLHGFAASSADHGGERLAYIPGMVLPKLGALSNPGYLHQYGVNGTPTAGDAFFTTDQAWHTVLLGGLNEGGRGIYALDITHPASFSEATAASTVLWEFSSDDDPDLGYSFSQPAIVRLHHGKWAAIFGNGYNNSGSGHAVLFVVDIENGQLLRKIDTGSGSTTTPNGLSSVAPVDTDGDFIVDTLYAGDLEGQLWKFDLSASQPNSWGIDNLGGGPSQPLFTAINASGQRQPITSRPEVGRGPGNRDLMVYFGTGRYLQSSDLNNTERQSFYGIIDRDAPVAGRTNLLQQSITYQGVQLGYELRTTSNHFLFAHHDGWYMDLIDPAAAEPGERVVSNPVLRNRRIIFTTLIPATGACSSGGSSWLMELDAWSGSRLQDPSPYDLSANPITDLNGDGTIDDTDVALWEAQHSGEEVAPFDLNGDGEFNQDDMLHTEDTNGDGVVDRHDAARAPSGKRSNEGIINTPGIIADGEQEIKYAAGSSGRIETTTENPGAGGYGRQSWRQLR